MRLTATRAGLLSSSDLIALVRTLIRLALDPESGLLMTSVGNAIHALVESVPSEDIVLVRQVDRFRLDRFTNKQVELVAAFPLRWDPRYRRRSQLPMAFPNLADAAFRSCQGTHFTPMGRHEDALWFNEF
jgi:hypothetical protein